MLKSIEKYVKTDQNYIKIIEIALKIIRHSQISYL
jgi:hypothetical protein